MKRKAFPYTIFTFLLIFSCQNPEADTSTIIQDYFQPYPNEMIAINSSAAASSMGDQAMRLYEEQRYDQAIILFNELIQIEGSVEKRYSWIFYKGNAQMAQGQLEEALTNFGYLPAGHPFFEEGLWLQGLIYLQQNQKEKAKMVFRELDQTSPRYSESQALLKRLF